MYYYCTALSSVVVPTGITYIDKEAFAYSSITEITIPSSVTGSDSTAFKECKSLALIKGVKGSYAETLATSLGIAFEEVK